MIDNLSNSSKNTLFGIKKILGYVPDFFEGDICDHEFLSAVFEKYFFDAVIHFAGLK
jgi:UDP-glucose 4-epimerase